MNEMSVSFIKSRLIFVLAMTFCLVWNVCAADKTVKPDWIIALPESGDYIYAVGIGDGGKIEDAREVALQNARKELGKTVNKKVTSLCNDYIKHSKSAVGLDNFSTGMALKISNKVIKGAELKDSYTEKTNKIQVYYALLAVRTKTIEMNIEEYRMSMHKEPDYKAVENDLEAMVSSIKSRYNSEMKEKKKEVEEKKKAESPTLEVREGGKEPAWVKRLPNDRAYYIGVGNGTNLDSAKANAVNTIVSQIQVKIKSETKDYMREINGVSDEDVSVNIKLSVKADIEDVEYYDGWQSPNGTYWVYARLNIATYLRKQAEKMENARITALDYLRMSDEEDNPTLKFKYAFLGYYYISPYVTKALKADYNGKSVILLNELTNRMNKVIAATSISVYQTADELKMAKVDTKPLHVDVTFKNGDDAMSGLPVHFTAENDAAELTAEGVTDNDGEVTCIITKLSHSTSSFSVYAQPYFVGLIGGIIDDSEEIEFFEKKIAQFQTPQKQIVVEVERPTLGFKVFVTDEFRDSKFNSKAVNFGDTFKNKFADKMKTNFVDSGAQYNLEMTISGNVLPSDGPSGFIFARMTVSFKIIDNKTKKEIYNLVCDEIKQGANTDLKAVQKAMDKFDMNKAVNEILNKGIN